MEVFDDAEPWYGMEPNNTKRQKALALMDETKSYVQTVSN